MTPTCSNYQICKITVMDSTIPGTSFDADGYSNHYWDFKNTVEPNWHPDGKGAETLAKQVEQIRAAGRGKDFDCILGLSGGVDSSFMLHTMVREHGLRPLVFHVDGGWNSEMAVHNIEVLVEKLGVDLYTEVINWEEMRDFQLAWFRSGVPHIDIPQDHAFIAVLYQFAEKYGIKTILNGGNISTECVKMPYQYYYWGTDMSQIRDIIRRFGTVPMNTYPFSSVYRHKLLLRYAKGVQVFKPLNFMPFSKQRALTELESNYGWKAYPQKHFESRFTRFYEGYWLPTRFGFDVRRCQLSSLILTGQMTREAALEALETPSYDPETIEQDFDYIASKLRISTDELRGYHDMPLKFYWDYKNQHSVLSIVEKVASALKLGRRGGAY